MLETLGRWRRWRRSGRFRRSDADARKRRTRFDLFVAGFLAFAETGCITFHDKDTVHHLVLGIGVVSVACPSSSMAVVTDEHVLGLCISDQPGLKVGLGYSSSAVTEIADGAEDVRISVDRTPFGAIEIHAPSVKGK